jgi:hypothetical protein
MRTNIPNIVLFLLLSFLPGCTAKEEFTCYLAKPQDSYDYPIKPGTPEWEQLDNSDEMDSVLQIPKNVLDNISTEGLIETVLNYPRFGDLYSIDDYQFAFDQMKNHYNGFQGLFNRNDAAMKLYDRYKEMYPGCVKNNWPSINGPGSSSSFSFAFIEILLAQYNILSQFNNEQIRILLREAISKYNEKNAHDFSVFSKKHTILITGRILYMSNYSPFIEEYSKNYFVKDFIDKVVLNNNFETLDLVLDYAEKYLDLN